MIEVQNLVKDYGSRVAVDHISFEVEKGEIVGFLGPNGAGKTTTMRILTGFLPATSGAAKIAGFDIFEQSLESRRHVGYLPENVPLYLDMSVENYLTYMGRLSGLGWSELKSRIGGVMESCGVAHRRRDLIGKLSRGYRQRVGLAQALIHNPDVLILDEPTASMDPVQIREIRDYIRSLKGDHTIILSTHILPEVELVCDRVLMINQGHIVANDTPQNLRARAGKGHQIIALSARGAKDAIVKVIKAIDGVVKVTDGEHHEPGAQSFNVEVTRDLREDLAVAVIQGGFGLRHLEMGARSLEDTFVELTTEESNMAMAHSELAPTEEVKA